jgi:UDP-glucose 4-epimerase
MQAMGAEGTIEHLPARNEVKVAFSDHSRFREVFPTAKATPLEEGLGRMAEWAKAAGVRSSAPWKEVEIERNLPPSWRGLVP